MQTIKMNKLKIETESLEEFLTALKELFTPDRQPEPEQWPEIFDNHNNDIHPEYSIHMYTEYNDEKEVGYILIWAAKTPTPGKLHWGDTTPDILRTAMIGSKADVIRQSIVIWDKCNNEKYVTDFLTKCKAATEPAPTETIQPT